MVGPFVQLTCGGPFASGCVGCPPTTQGDPESTGREEGILSGTVGYLGHAGWARALMDCACVQIDPTTEPLPTLYNITQKQQHGGGRSVSGTTPPGGGASGAQRGRGKPTTKQASAPPKAPTATRRARAGQAGLDGAAPPYVPTAKRGQSQPQHPQPRHGGRSSKPPAGGRGDAASGSQPAAAHRGRSGHRVGGQARGAPRNRAGPSQARGNSQGSSRSRSARGRGKRGGGGGGGGGRRGGRGRGRGSR